MVAASAVDDLEGDKRCQERSNGDAGCLWLGRTTSRSCNMFRWLYELVARVGLFSSFVLLLFFSFFSFPFFSLLRVAGLKCLINYMASF